MARQVCCDRAERTLAEGQRRWLRGIVSVAWMCVLSIHGLAIAGQTGSLVPVTINRPDTGYRGIWYMNQPLESEYRYKYSGGLGTYCAKHRPFAVYCDEVKKTFFCYGGTTVDARPDDASTSDRQGIPRSLLHMVSYYDHQTGMVPRPTILLDKKTTDAHDNPVISVDDDGYIWIFSTSHGTSRPSYIHRSAKPYDVSAFELMSVTKVQGDKQVAMTNFSYMQPWHLPGQGFVAFFTRYNYPADRTCCFMTSADGVHWSTWQRLAAIERGHYQVSIADRSRAGTALNYHSKEKGLNWRTNLYYLETTDRGRSWHAADGREVAVPITTKQNPALVHDYEKDGLLVYLKDIRFDELGQPVILYITSKGFEAGPKNDPRTWTTAQWTGAKWVIRPAFTSDNNYDMGSLYLEADGLWRVIGPTETGPQPYNPGGEIAVWTSSDRGKTWRKVTALTQGSPFNHTYARKPVKAHDDFYALWADGHGRQPSASSIYFCNKAGDVFRLPREMDRPFAKPEPVK